MIETPVLDMLDAEDLLSLTASTHRQQVESDALILRLAAEWTDRYNADALQKRPTPRDDSGEVLPGMERPKQFGGEGTPKVLEFAPAEFGITLEMSTGQTEALIADVLDLRHRLPKLWARVCALQVPGWKARAVAKATRHLSLEDCWAVDEAIHQSIMKLAWWRFKTVLDGEIIKANPEEAQLRADAAERDRFVRLGRSNEYGLKTIYARAAAGDVLWLDATIDRLARIMAASGDADPLDVRRSKALGILANPLLAAGMLAEAQGLDLSDPADDEDPDDDGFPHDGHWVPPTRKEWVKEGEEEPPADPEPPRRMIPRTSPTPPKILTRLNPRRPITATVMITNGTTATWMPAIRSLSLSKGKKQHQEPATRATIVPGQRPMLTRSMMIMSPPELKNNKRALPATPNPATPTDRTAIADQMIKIRATEIGNPAPTPTKTINNRTRTSRVKSAHTAAPPTQTPQQTRTTPPGWARSRPRAATTRVATPTARARPTGPSAPAPP